MSGKSARRLRKAAMGLAVSLDEAGRKIHPRDLLAQEHKRPSVEGFSSAVPPKDRVDDPRSQTYAVTAINRPDSLRGIIRSMKKQARA